MTRVNRAAGRGAGHICAAMMMSGSWFMMVITLAHVILPSLHVCQSYRHDIQDEARKDDHSEPHANFEYPVVVVSFVRQTKQRRGLDSSVVVQHKDGTSIQRQEERNYPAFIHQQSPKQASLISLCSVCFQLLIQSNSTALPVSVALSQ